MEKTKGLNDFDAWLEGVRKLASQAPDDAHFYQELDVIIAQLEADDLSSLGPELQAEIKKRRAGLRLSTNNKKLEAEI